VIGRLNFYDDNVTDSRACHDINQSISHQQSINRYRSALKTFHPSPTPINNGFNQSIPTSLSVNNNRSRNTINNGINQVMSLRIYNFPPVSNQLLDIP